MTDTGAASTTPSTTTSMPLWYTDLDEVHRGHVVARGWDKMDPAAAARAAVQAHREAQAEFSRIHGAPADQIMRLPKDAADPGWAEVHKRLGVPDKADDYKIEGLKFADGSAPDDTFIGHMRALAHELKLPAGAATALTARVMALADSDAAEAIREQTAARGANDAELRRSWGPNHDYFRFQVGRAADILGIPNDLMVSMERRPTAEYLKFMDALRGLAGKMGEAELLRGERGGQDRVLSREEAVARLAALRNDTAWTQRLIAGDTAAKTELENLSRVVVGPPLQGAPPNAR